MEPTNLAAWVAVLRAKLTHETDPALLALYRRVLVALTART